MRFQEMSLTPELDEMQRAGLVWYRAVRGNFREWDLDDSDQPPSYFEKYNRGAYEYAVRLEE